MTDRSGLVAVLRPKTIDGQFVLTGGAAPDGQTLAGVTALFGRFAACANEPDTNFPAVNGAIFPDDTVYIMKRTGDSWRIDDVIGPAQPKGAFPPATPVTTAVSTPAAATP